MLQCLPYCFLLLALVPFAAQRYLIAETAPASQESDQEWVKRFAQDDPALVTSALREFSTKNFNLSTMHFSQRAVLGLLCRSQPELRKAAEQVLLNCGPTCIEAMAVKLRGDWFFKSDRLRSFGHLKGPYQVMLRPLPGTISNPMEGLPTDMLVQALGNENSAVRIQAMRAVQNRGPRAKAAVPALAQFLASSSKDAHRDSERVAALQALAAIGPDAKEALPALVQTLEPFRKSPPSPNERPEIDGLIAYALHAIGNLHRHGGPACPVVIDFLSFERYRRNAQHTLKAIDLAARSALSANLSQPADGSKLLRARALLEIVPTDPAATDFLTGAAKENSSEAAALAKRLLTEVKPGTLEYVRWHLGELLAESNSPLGAGLDATLSRHVIQQSGNAAVPLLAEAIKNCEVAELRAIFIEELSKIEPRNPQIASILFEELDRNLAQVHEKTFRALYDYKNLLTPARDKLKALLKAGNMEAAANALYLLAVSAPDFHSISAMLAESLKDERNAIRTTAAFAAGTFGPQAAALKDEIAKLLEDPCVPARQHAALALLQIDPKTPLLDKCAPHLAAFIGSAYNESSRLNNVAIEGLRSLGAPAIPILAKELQATFLTYSTEEVTASLQSKRKLPDEQPEERKRRLRENSAILLCGIEFIEYEVQRNGKPVK